MPLSYFDLIIHAVHGLQKFSFPFATYSTTVLACGCSMFCAQPPNVETALDEQILHFGLGSEPQHLDPHLATSVAAHNILSALLEGLVSEDPKTLKPLPGVAKSWEILEEGRKYIFHIRKKAFAGAMGTKLRLMTLFFHSGVYSTPTSALNMLPCFTHLKMPRIFTKVSKHCRLRILELKP